jgi:hypothetical protein
MKKYLLLLLSVSLSGCITFHYPSHLVCEAEKGRVLFQWKDHKDELSPPLSIVLNGAKAGEIVEESRPLTDRLSKFLGPAFSYEVAFTDFRTGKRYIIWRYGDYAWLESLTQGPEQNIIRLYHGHQLIFLRFYVTELNVQTRQIRKFELSREEYDKLTK